MEIPHLWICRQLGDSRCDCVVWPRWYARMTGKAEHQRGCYMNRALQRAVFAGVAHDPWHSVTTWVSVRTDGTAEGMGHPCFNEEPRSGRWNTYPVRYVQYTDVGLRELGLPPGSVAFAFMEVGTLDEDAALAETLELYRKLTDAGAWGNADASAEMIGGEAYDNGHREIGVRVELTA